MAAKLFLEAIKKWIYWRRLHKQDVNQWRIEKLRSYGAKIGKDCRIFSMAFSTEPYLVTIGDHVTIASGTHLITHKGAEWLLRRENPNISVFGKINIKNNVFVGINCIILPDTYIGNNCVIGAGSVVRGKFPDDSVVIGNPAKIIMETSIMNKRLLNSKNRIDTKLLNPLDRRKIIEEHFGISKVSRSAIHIVDENN